MKEYPVGHKFYASQGLEHVEGKIPVKFKELYQLLADQQFNGSMIAAISYWLVTHLPKINKKKRNRILGAKRTKQRSTSRIR